MRSGSSYTIEARIDHRSEGVGCFDPIRVIHRLRGAFPEIIEQDRDYLAETCDRLRQIDGADEAFRTAVRDMQERGPKIQFEIPVSGGQTIKGTAERYWVLVTSEKEFPEDFRHRFTEFLGGLKLQAIEIRSGDNLA